MRRGLLCAFLAVFFARPAAAGEAARDRLSRFYSAWYSVCPSTRVTVSPATEIAVPGYEAYRVERHCDLKNRNEMSVTLVDSAKNQLFVGEVLHSEERRGEPFAAAKDIPVLQAALRDAYGVPVSIELGPETRGPLQPIRLSLEEAEGASASLSGFVSRDGATLLIGEFLPLGADPAEIRERWLADSPGVRPQKGSFFVTAFIDFQCEKCRKRTPEVRDVARARGGALEIRFLPLVKAHDWAFAAAESAAGLANVSPELYARYEEALFPRAGEMTAAAARELALDVAEAGGRRAAFESELASGRARRRVVGDINLALRLGLNGTPVFFYGGAFLTSEPGLAENYIQGHLPGPPGAPGRGSRR